MDLDGFISVIHDHIGLASRRQGSVATDTFGDDNWRRNDYLIEIARGLSMFIPTQYTDICM